MPNNYERTLEVLLLFFKKSKSLSAIAMVRKSKINTEFILKIMDSTSKADIVDFNYLVSDNIEESIKYFNQKSWTLDQLLNFNKSQDIFITRCLKCGNVRTSKTKRSRVCNKCISEMAYYAPQQHIQYNHDKFVYLIKNMNTHALKIGYSRDPRTRIKQLQTGSSDKLELLCYIPGNKSVEKELQNQFIDFSIGGEWFSYHDCIIEEFNNIFKIHTGQSLVL